MRSRENIKIEQYVLYLIYPTVFLVQFFLMFGYNLNAIIHIPILLLFILFSVKKIWQCARRDFYEHHFLFFYFLYVLFSVAWYVFNGIPIAAYIGNLKLFVLPMLFYFWGADKNDLSDRFINVFLISITVVVIISLYLYFTLPSFYVDFILEAKQNSAMASQWHNESNIMDHARFSGFFQSSYAISYMGMTAFCIAMSYVVNHRGIYSKFSLLVIAFIHFLGIVLCLQRIAWGMLFLYSLYYSFCLLKNKRNIILILAIIAALVFVIINTDLGLTDRFDDVNTLISDRSENMSFQKAMGSRLGQYESVDFFSIDKIFGNGLGSSGFYAVTVLGEEGVTDGEYIKQIMEFGYVGLLLFFLFVTTSFMKVLKKYKIFILELFIAFYFIAAGIGHNSLNSYYYTYIFWYVMGRINNKSYRKQILLNYN